MKALDQEALDQAVLDQDMPKAKGLVPDPKEVLSTLNLLQAPLFNNIVRGKR